MKEFFEAIREGNLELVKTIIGDGVDVNATDVNGSTPLYLACFKGHTDIVELLINNKADVNGANGTEYERAKPLYVACSIGYIDIVKLLIEKGANVNAANSERSTPLHAACENDYVEIAKLLIENNADVNATDVNGSTPLYVASLNGHTEIVRLLIENNADVNAVNERAPLYLACSRGYIDLVKLLIEKGANVNALTRGYTPLHQACENDYVEIAKLLIENNADVNAVDKDGHTPLYYALHIFHTSTQKLRYTNIANLLISAMLLKNIAQEKPNYIQKRVLYFHDGKILSDYWDKQKAEILSLKKVKFKVKFGEISLFDLYNIKDVNKLADISCKIDVQDTIAKPDFIKKYPIFGIKIKDNFEKGLARNDALNKAIDSARLINNDMMNLPPECSEKILKYLDKQDMDNVISAFSFFKSASAVSNTSETIKTCNVLSKS